MKFDFLFRVFVVSSLSGLMCLIKFCRRFMNRIAYTLLFSCDDSIFLSHQSSRNLTSLHWKRAKIVEGGRSTISSCSSSDEEWRWKRYENKTNPEYWWNLIDTKKVGETRPHFSRSFILLFFFHFTLFLLCFFVYIYDCDDGIH
jgi:hypothetical protein